MSSRSTGSSTVGAGTFASLRARSRRSSTSRWRPIGLLEHAAVRRNGIGDLGVGEIDLQLGPDPGERTPQLVRRVGDEAPLTVDRGADTLEHPVHRPRQARDLVVPWRHGHPTLEVGAADRGDLGSDGLDRPQRSSHEPPHEDAKSAARRARSRAGRRPAPACSRRCRRWCRRCGSRRDHQASRPISRSPGTRRCRAAGRPRCVAPARRPAVGGRRWAAALRCWRWMRAPDPPGRPPARRCPRHRRSTALVGCRRSRRAPRHRRACRTATRRARQ